MAPVVVLTGFMGTGKTSAGRLLAERLGLDFLDTDAVIESRHGPIPDIFAAGGESSFRTLEREVAAELADVEGAVVATGGRTMLDPANRATLGARAPVVCLTASAERIVQRLLGGGIADRPLLAVADPEARVRELLAERQAGYERFPCVDTDGRNLDAVVDAIIELLEVAT